MAATLPFSYPLDPTGINPANLVVGEIHTTLNRTTRAVVTNYGAFFGSSMVIKDLATGVNLTSSQWYPAQLYTQPTLQYGAPIYSLIMITDATVSDNIALTYQALGGPYSTSQSALVDYINNLDLDSRPASWPDIINKPDAFTPSPHLHDVGTIYGFEYIVQALDNLTYAIQVGDAAYNDSLLAYVDAQNSNLSAQLSALQAQLTAHINNVSNPHQVTAAQVGAYTKAQSDSNLNAATTSLNTSIAQVQTNLNAHTANTNNPHSTTAAQVGAYTTAQSDSNLSSAVTTLNTAIGTVQTNLTSHTSNVSNPHQTTAAQVGAMTTAQTNSAIAASAATLNTSISTVSNNLASHVANTSNPHQTTAAQLGVYTTAQSDSIMAANVNNLQANINTKAAASLPFAYLNNTVTFADIHATGTIYSNNDVWAFNSDERIKRDFQSIPDPISLVMQLGGYFHRYKPEFAEVCDVDAEEWYVGVKAQEVEKVLPMIVGLAPFDRDPVTGESISGENYLTVKYEKIVPLLIEAIKHLSNDLGQVKMEFAKLERKLIAPRAKR